MYFNSNIGQLVELLRVSIYLVLFIWTAFILSFKSFRYSDFKVLINKMELERITLLKLNQSYEKENHRKYVHVLKSMEDLDDDSNTNLLCYFSVMVIIYDCADSLQYFNSIGHILFISIVALSLTICVILLIWEVLNRFTWVSIFNIF